MFKEAAVDSLDLSVLCCGFILAGVKAEVGDSDVGPVRFMGGEVECLAVARKDYVVGNAVVGKDRVLYCNEGARGRWNTS